MKKSIYALFLIAICCVFCLGGCGNEISEKIFETNAFRILRQVDSSGKITLTYIFPVNSKKLEKLQFDDTDSKIYKFYLSTYVSTLAEKYRENANDGTKVSKCVYYTDVDGVGFSMEFENLDAQKQFFGVEEEEEDDVQSKSSGFFMKKVELKTTFPVSSQQSAENLKQVCLLAINSWSSQNQIDSQKSTEMAKMLDDSVFIYDTASANNNLKSEIMYEGGGLKHNVFIKSQEDIQQNNEILFFVSYPNTAIWYLSAVLIVVVGMFCAYFWIKRKKKL